MRTVCLRLRSCHLKALHIRDRAAHLMLLITMAIQAFLYELYGRMLKCVENCQYFAKHDMIFIFTFPAVQPLMYCSVIWERLHKSIFDLYLIRSNFGMSSFKMNPSVCEVFKISLLIRHNSEQSRSYHQSHRFLSCHSETALKKF